ncbi:hypothetical protein FOMPIDRAFT_93691 [Fomitopsis schrenkii]|uniref:ABM domain-containing protein n=1 Tax=Fomitopsis schrenkii TaxID=2126942 RepID=S8DL40_FOMSC|nr:hypothetical protein FOMPIDRAFT_93691 [Fomitopsis schrenkii]
MSLPLVELIVGHLKEGVTTAHPSFKKLRDACALGGLTKQTYGVAVENPRKLYWVIHYETITPKDFLSKWPSDFCDYAKEVGEIMTEEPVSYYLPRDSCDKLFPKATTDARVTEIAIVEPKNADDLEYYKEVQRDAVDAQAAESTAHEGWYSLIKTEKGVWTGVIFVGWDSAEAHNAAAAKNAALLQPFHGVAALVWLVHVSMTDHV